MCVLCVNYQILETSLLKKKKKKEEEKRLQFYIKKKDFTGWDTVKS